jgi:hypothetical protein
MRYETPKSVEEAITLLSGAKGRGQGQPLGTVAAHALLVPEAGIANERAGRRN